MKFIVSSSVNQSVVDHIKKRLGVIRQKMKTPRMITVGIHSREGSKDKIGYKGEAVGKTVAEIMSYHEFGTDRIPRRSWLRTWVAANQEQLADMLRTAAIRATGIDRGMFGASTGQLDAEELNRTALEYQKMLRQWIEADEAKLPRLLKKTVIKKEQAGLPQPETPLVATLQFVDSIRSKVNGKYAK